MISMESVIVYTAAVFALGILYAIVAPLVYTAWLMRQDRKLIPHPYDWKKDGI